MSTRTVGRKASLIVSRVRCPSSGVGHKAISKSGFRSNDLLPDTNTCISLLRQKHPHLIARWRSAKLTDIVLCSIVVYELRHGAESSSDPAREHAKLDVFVAPFSSLPFDDA